MSTGNYRVTVPLTTDHSPVVLYSEQGVGAQFAPGYKAPAAPTTASEAINIDIGKDMAAMMAAIKKAELAALASGAAPAAGKTAPTTASEAAVDTGKAAPAATTPAAAAPVAGGVNYQQQGTIVVQHQGFLSAGAPYPQQQYYQPQPQAPIIYQMPAAPAPAAPAAAAQARGSGNGPA